jgi:hypothetical protein
MFKRILLPVSLLCMALLAACDDAADPIRADPVDASLRLDAFEKGRGQGNDPFSVLTHNVYLGADISPIFQVDFGDPVAIVQASVLVWGQVQDTRFAERKVTFVEEIKEQRPHLIGLQEVARFITLDALGAPTGALDVLAVLASEIEACGLGYHVVEVQENRHVTLPVAVQIQPFLFTEYVDFTDRDVVLARSDARITRTDKGNYTADSTLAPEATLKRGWIRVDAAHKGETHHFVNTHLEGQSMAPVQEAQVQGECDGRLDRGEHPRG